MKLNFLAFAAALSLFALPAAAAQLNVPMNESSVVHMEGEASTVIVGNPMIADVSVVDGNGIVVHGRLFGNTSVTVLDSGGQELMTISVSVTDTWRGGVALHTMNPQATPGGASINYVCNPDCVRAFHPGDEQAESEDLSNQSGAWQDLTNRGAGQSE